MGALAAAKRKAHVIADVVAHAQTDFAAKPMADAPALARSDAAADSQALVGALARSEAGAYAATDASALAGAIPKTNPSSHAKTHALADGDARRPHGGARIFADAAAFVAADLDADQNSDVCTESPAHAAADAPPDPESLSGAVE